MRTAKTLSDWADAQADPSLCWAHTHFVGFVMSQLINEDKFHTDITMTVHECRYQQLRKVSLC